jgi:hypothetical protein
LVQTFSGNVICSPNMALIGVLLEHDGTESHAAGEDPVKDGRLPFDEGFILKNQGHAAKDDDQHQADPKHFVDLAVTETRPR